MKIMGMMSGTSLDGIDAVLMEVEEAHPLAGDGGAVALGPGDPPPVAWEILAFRTRPYSPGERETIKVALASGGPRDLALLHTRLGEWFARAALELLEETGMEPEWVAAIGSHGQTVWHEPPMGSQRGTSLQLGCPATLAERTGIGVVSDFRSRDLAAGGHGAPLVPWADRVFFSSASASRAIQNLGGMGNVTWLPRSGEPAPLVAFDTGPGVALLDAAAELATGGQATYDKDGELARTGRVSQGVLGRLLAHPFFREPPPRSTGRELFGPELLRETVDELENEMGMKLVPGSAHQGWPDLLATLTALTSGSIGDAYRRWVLPLGTDEVFLMGGGARNPILVQAIAEELAPVPVLDGQALGMDPDAREAASFALLAWAHLRGLPGNVPEATGSRGRRVLGSWTPGPAGGAS